MFSLRCLSVCLSVGLLATLSKNFRTDLHEIFGESLHWANEQTIIFLVAIQIHGLFFGFVILVRKVVSTDCAARRCSAGHALAGIAIATVTSWCALFQCF